MQAGLGALGADRIERRSWRDSGQRVDNVGHRFLP